MAVAPTVISNNLSRRKGLCLISTDEKSATAQNSSSIEVSFLLNKLAFHFPVKLSFKFTLVQIKLAFHVKPCCNGMLK